jgi:hypothetical protein
MPRASSWFVRAALLYLLAGFTVGALLLMNKALAWSPLWWLLLPAHIEFLVIGWTLLLAMGVAYWILPRFQTERRRVWLVWSAFALLNLGLWAVALAPFAGNGQVWVAIGRSAETAAAAAFAIHAWPRIKPAGT